MLRADAHVRALAPASPSFHCTDNSFGQLDKRLVILMRDLDNSFRNELEKMKDNEASITHRKNGFRSDYARRTVILRLFCPVKLVRKTVCRK